jgi:hypothetical protein
MQFGREYELCSYAVMGTVFSATFNNISAISWRLDLMVEEETAVSRENH